MIQQHEQSWIEVRAHALNAIQEARTNLEQHPLSEQDSSFLRGKIAALRGILALAETQTEWTPTAKVDYMRM